MPVKGRNTPTLVDTSVAVALAVADHNHHLETVRQLRGRTLGLAGHAAFETFSVLTRLPSPVRKTPATVTHLLLANFPETRFLGAQAAAALLADLQRMEIAGGGNL
jgi:hypothetical protein